MTGLIPLVPFAVLGLLGLGRVRVIEIHRRRS